MKITMVGNFGLWHKGTMGVRALPMAKALASRGHDVCLIIPPWDDPKESGIETDMERVRIANVKLPPGVPLIWHALLTINLLRRTLREPADVVHIFKPKAYAGFVGLALWMMKRLRLYKARLVVDTDDWEGDGGWNDLESFPRVVKWFISWHERTALRCSDAVTVASRALELIVWSLGVKRRHVFYVPNGMWLSGGKDPVAVPGCPGVAPSGIAGYPVILLYTRFFEYRPEKIVDILSALKNRGLRLKLLIVGKGLYGEEDVLREKLREAGLASDVVFAGWQRAEEVPGWLSLGDIAIYPMDDNLLNRAKCPMKLVDLMANGIPVVAESVGQVSEYVEHGSSGILVEPGDIDGFATAVAELLDDERTRRLLGEAAKRRIAEVFDWRRLVDEVEASYRVSS